MWRSITPLSIMTQQNDSLLRNAKQNNDTQDDDTQYRDIKYN